MKTIHSAASLSQKQTAAKLSLFERLRHAVSLKVTAMFFAAGIATTAPQTANANISSCMNFSEAFKSVVTAPESEKSPDATLKSEKSPNAAPKNNTVITYQLDIKKEIRETPSTKRADLVWKTAIISTQKNSSLNFRDDNGEVVWHIPFGRQITLSGEQKETKAGTYVRIQSWIGQNLQDGWVSFKYLTPQDAIAPTIVVAPAKSQKAPVFTEISPKKSLEKTSLKQTTPEKVAKEAAKKPLPTITEEDRTKFEYVGNLLAKKASSLGLHIESFKAAIAKNEGNGSYSQTNQKLAEKLGIESDKVADGRYQFIPATRAWVNRAFFGKPHSHLRSLFLKNGEFQEALMDGLIALNIDSMNANSYLSNAIENKKVSPTFVLSAMHYSGIDGAKKAVRAALAGKTLTGKTDWIGKTDIFTYASTAEATYNEKMGIILAKANPEKADTIAQNTPQAEEKTSASENVIQANFTKKAEENTAAKKTGTLSEKEENALRSNLTSYIHRTQTDMIAAKVAYRKQGDITKMQAVTEYILASERRIRSVSGVESIPKFYKETIATLEAAVATSNNPIVLAKNQDALMIVKKEFHYAVSLAKQISSGQLAIEKPAVLIRNDTVYALDSIIRKAA